MSETSPPIDTTGWIAIGVVIVMTLLIVSAFLNSGTSTSSAAPARSSSQDRGSGRIRFACTCATEPYKGYLAWKATSEKDFPALLGMLQRGDIVKLSAGDKVHMAGTSDGFTYVLVLSGYHIDRRCWIPSGFAVPSPN